MENNVASLGKKVIRFKENMKDCGRGIWFISTVIKRIVEKTVVYVEDIPEPGSEEEEEL
jgi:hypothetical protein